MQWPAAAAALLVRVSSSSSSTKYGVAGSGGGGRTRNHGVSCTLLLLATAATLLSIVMVVYSAGRRGGDSRDVKEDSQIVQHVKNNGGNNRSTAGAHAVSAAAAVATSAGVDVDNKVVATIPHSVPLPLRAHMEATPVRQHGTVNVGYILAIAGAGLLIVLVGAMLTAKCRDEDDSGKQDDPDEGTSPYAVYCAGGGEDDDMVLQECDQYVTMPGQEETGGASMHDVATQCIRPGVIPNLSDLGAMSVEEEEDDEVCERSLLLDDASTSSASMDDHNVSASAFPTTSKSYSDYSLSNSNCHAASTATTVICPANRQRLQQHSPPAATASSTTSNNRNWSRHCNTSDPNWQILDSI